MLFVSYNTLSIFLCVLDYVVCIFHVYWAMLECLY